MPRRCPIRNPLLRTRALIVFEAIRLMLVLAIIGWWGWLLVDKTQYILSLEGELVMHDAAYIPLHEGEKVVTMVTAEAVVLIGLVLVSSLFAFWLALRDIRRTRALQSFFASMAHELRTPLAGVRLQIEGIRHQASGNSVTYLDRLSEDLTRFEMQLDRGLELARSESGKALAVSKVDLAEVWRSAAPCPILAVTGKPEGRVLADAHALNLIFRNIIENAQVHGKATSLGIRQQASGDRVELTFTDNGNGCADAKKLGKLFAKGTDSKGTGVGLYLMKSLMKQMGGSAEFASSSEGFVVTLTFCSLTEQVRGGDSRRGERSDGGGAPTHEQNDA